MLFLSALDASASSATFEKLRHVKACVNPSLMDILSEQAEPCDDQLSVTISSLVVFLDDTFPRCEKTNVGFHHTSCNRSRAFTYLTLKVLRI